LEKGKIAPLATAILAAFQITCEFYMSVLEVQGRERTVDQTLSEHGLCVRGEFCVV
jgi:hypothetical protein